MHCVTQSVSRLSRYKPLLLLTLLTLLIYPLFAQRPILDDETTSTKLEKARHLDLEVLKLYQNKRYQTAIDSSTIALKLYHEVFGANHLEVATTYQNIAEFQFNLREYDAALQNLENALRIREKRLSKNHLLIAETQRKLGLLKSRLGEYGAADSLYQQAYRSILVTRKQYHPDMRPLAEDLRNLAVLYESRGKLPRAQQLYEQSYRIISLAIGSRSYDLMYLNRDLRALALLYSKRGELSDASSLYQKTLTQFSRLLSTDDPEVLRSAENLRDVSKQFLAEFNFDQTVTTLEISYKYITNSLGKNDAYIAGFGEDYRVLARVEMSKDKLRDAERHLHRAEEIWDDTIDKIHPDRIILAMDFRDLGKLYQKNNLLRDAEAQFDNNFRIMVVQLGADNPELADFASDYRLLGKSAELMNELTYAEKLFNRAYKIVIEKAGSGHPALPVIGRDFRDLAGAYNGNDVDNYDKISALLKRSIDIFEESDSENQQEILETCNDLVILAKAYERRNYTGNALEIYQYVLPQMTRFLGENHPDVVSAKNEIARLRGSQLAFYQKPRPAELQLESPSQIDNRSPVLSAENSLPPREMVIDVIRYPTLKAPETVTPASTFDVKISLTTDLLTPEVEILAGQSTSRGELVMRLPDRDKWQIDVIIAAPQFEVLDGKNIAQITLPREGNSSEATYKIRVPGAECAPSQSTIYATLWHEGTFLAKISRRILVSGLENELFASASGAIENETGARPGIRSEPNLRGDLPEINVGGETITQVPSISLAKDYQTPDLTVWILKDYEAENAGRYELQINSPYLQPYSGEFVITPRSSDWLEKQTLTITRGAVPINAPTGTVSNEKPAQRVLRLQAFGKQLYKELAPAELKSAIRELLQKRGDKFKSIQIYTNNPGIPWELMHTAEAMNGFDKPDFLGTRFRIARWHISGNFNVLSRPPQRNKMDELVLISPRYEGRMALPSQQKEIAALQSISGFRQVSGKFDPLQELFGNFPSGIIHFAGHGEVQQSFENIPEYVILLEDAKLDLLTWRGIASGSPRNNPFFFFNACDVGQSHNVANFVDGWAPAVLETGASGYIGGLWPLGDASAADFAVRFYEILDEKLKDGPVNVADLLRETRKNFTENGDPTFLAYIYYGDPNFEFVRR